jgi:hypothetical protein
MLKSREFTDIFPNLFVTFTLYGYQCRARAQIARLSLGHSREAAGAVFSAIAFARLSLSQRYEPTVTSVRAAVCSTSNLLSL